MLMCVVAAFLNDFWSRSTFFIFKIHLKIPLLHNKTKKKSTTIGIYSEGYIIEKDQEKQEKIGNT